MLHKLVENQLAFALSFFFFVVEAIVPVGNNKSVLINLIAKVWELAASLK